MRRRSAGCAAMGPDAHCRAEQLLAAHRAEFRERYLEAGAVGRLLVSGELQEVLPLDEAGALDAARPVTPDGLVRIDPAKVEARHDAQVKAALATGPVPLIVLGGAHDLRDAVLRLGGGRVEYLRVRTARNREFAPRW
jgi:hypothetical protein